MERSAALEMLPLGDARSELTLVGSLGARRSSARAPLMKVVQKDGDRFPELAAKVNGPDHRRGPRPGRDSRWRASSATARSTNGGRGLASVALGSLVGYRIEEAMFGPRPVGEEDFLEAWVDVLMAYAERKLPERAA